ncbi:hypothetical protein AX16_003699 [Volvariella volvacea WC 439]|nr:hypothetical protein AX16_003699 [Volvariella volvacea WC 439]
MFIFNPTTILSPSRACQTFRKLNTKALDAWIKSPPQPLLISDTISAEHLSDLYITVPTRDGSHKPFQQPVSGQRLGYGHHLAFFHNRTPEHQLRSDGTGADFCPPHPFTRRMWAGGSFTWNNKNPLRVKDKGVAKARVVSVQKKGLEGGIPMAFVKMEYQFMKQGSTVPSLVEDRTHVYLAQGAEVRKTTRDVKVPKRHDFSFVYTPSQTTLFRFSAVTFNAHHIHLDKDYAQRAEGYPERLVHGPLTALMLLETAIYHHPNVSLSSFEYRAQNPLVVGRELTMYGKWLDEKKISLWCQDGGVVGMTGVVIVDSD